MAGRRGLRVTRDGGPDRTGRPVNPGAMMRAMKARPSGRHLLARCVVVVVVPLVGAGAVDGCSGRVHPGAAATPGLGTAAPGSPVPVPSTRAITSASRLRCDDGTTGVNAPDPSRQRANGLTADGWSNRVLAAPSTTAAGQVIFCKAFLYATKDAQRWTTVTIDRPATARLYYVPFVAWSTHAPGAELDLSHLASGQRAIAFEFCGQEPLGYPGGVLTQGPACLTLIVRADARPDAIVRCALGVPCS